MQSLTVKKFLLGGKFDVNFVVQFVECNLYYKLLLASDTGQAEFGMIG